jgi:hypothetical protein
VGTKSIVINVDTANPPNIVIPKGRQVSDPTPVDMAKGNNPTKVVTLIEQKRPFRIVLFTIVTAQIMVTLGHMEFA